ncbi:MAG: hypothetical protein BWK78_01745 [Thiotrichaceae bacterium IS1]|nr:MAG: hypothetical protein BWK78_01745 [Thiotrichaceae bacterium IS1]
MATQSKQLQGVKRLLEKDTLKNVFLNRSGKILAVAVQLNSSSEFGLVTWLVIQGRQITRESQTGC